MFDELQQRLLCPHCAVVGGDEKVVRVAFGRLLHCFRRDAGEVRLAQHPRECEVVVVIAQQRTVFVVDAPFGHNIRCCFLLSAALWVHVRHPEVECVRERLRQLLEPACQLSRRVSGPPGRHLHSEAGGVGVGVRFPGIGLESAINLPERPHALLRGHSFLAPRSRSLAVHLPPPHVLNQRRSGELMRVAHENATAVLRHNRVSKGKKGQALKDGGGSGARNYDYPEPHPSNLRK
mmetsp:Transcript_8432/g.15246  ORF Transcript_8432/g.15246 Transcript_8432/m.15246 type:complete len:235 (-) Transcript_8432:362-1066(-)